MTAFDIETAPQARALALSYPREERQHPTNYKDPEKIAAWYERDEVAWKEGLAKEAALTPRLGRIVAVGAGDASGVWAQTALDESGEADLIRRAFDLVAEIRVGPIVTFNGLTFDFPYLHTRAAILGVPIPYTAQDYLRRYSTRPHCDIRAVLANWDSRAAGTLHDWCAAFGIEVTDETTGADVAAAVDRGDAEAVRDHLASDVALTATLYGRLAAVGLVS